MAYGNENIIISADDFGISKLADVNILKLVEAGKIDRVEVMMSPNLNLEEVSRLKNSQVKIDIHLHLIKDDSDYWRGDRRLKEGAFKRMVLFVFNYFSGKSSSEKVELKWAIQIEKFREVFGKNPEGIGSHEYIHFFPPYMKAVLKLAKKYEIPYVRMGNKDLKAENMVSMVLNWLRKKNVKKFQESGLLTSPYMASLDWAKNLGDIEKIIPMDGKTELVCHPEREEEFGFMKEN